MVLGMDFPRLEEDSDKRQGLVSAIEHILQQLPSYPISQMFQVLKNVMVNLWSEPTLLSMMNNQDVDEEKGEELCTLWAWIGLRIMLNKLI